MNTWTRPLHPMATYLSLNAIHVNAETLPIRGGRCMTKTSFPTAYLNVLSLASIPFFSNIPAHFSVADMVLKIQNSWGMRVAAVDPEDERAVEIGISFVRRMLLGPVRRLKGPCLSARVA